MNKRQLTTAIALTLTLSVSIPVFAKGGGFWGKSGQCQAQYLAKFDADGNGNVTREERQAVRSSKFQAADTDGDGFLSMPEAEVMRENHKAERVAMRFDCLDTNSNNEVSSEEFQAGYRKLNTNAANNMFSMGDTDGSGSLTLEEFSALKNPENRSIWHYNRMDSDGDGQVSETEFLNAKSKRGHRHGRHDH